MTEHYFLVDYDYIRKGKIVIRTAEDCVRADAYTVLQDALQMSRIVTVRNITKLARKPHKSHLEPVCNCHSSSVGQWAWHYYEAK